MDAIRLSIHLPVCLPADRGSLMELSLRAGSLDWPLAALLCAQPNWYNSQTLQWNRIGHLPHKLSLLDKLAGRISCHHQVRGVGQPREVRLSGELMLSQRQQFAWRARFSQVIVRSVISCKTGPHKLIGTQFYLSTTLLTRAPPPPVARFNIHSLTGLSQTLPSAYRHSSELGAHKFQLQVNKHRLNRILKLSGRGSQLEKDR